MRNRLVALGLTVTFTAAAGSALGDDLPAGYGVETPSGSVFTTEIVPGGAAGDSDDYVFRGYPGMIVSAVVKPAKGSALVPELLFVRPGGTLATDEDGLAVVKKGTSLAGTMRLDAPGWWQIRVRGADLDPSAIAVDRSSGAYSISVKYGAPALPALPALSRTFKVAGVIDSKSDTDDYRFEGYPGQTVSAVLKGAPTLIPAIELIRPDGTTVTGPDLVTTKGTKLTLNTTTMDQQGTWRLHVVGLEPPTDTDPNVNTSTTGAYTLQVKLGKVSPAPSLQPDANRQYRFTIPAAGGTTIAYTLAYSGAAPALNSFLDPTGALVPGFGGGTSVASYTLSGTLPIGNYTLTFDAPATPPTGVSFTPRLVLPKGAKSRKVKLSSEEPVVTNNSLNPTAGGPGTVVSVGTNGKLLDPNDDDPEKIRMHLNHVALTGVVWDSSRNQVRGTIPGTLGLGTYDVVVESSTGQVGVKAGAFQRVAPPIAATIDPVVGTSAGGFAITIVGAGFRPGRIGIHIDGALVPVNITDATDSSVTFVAPPRSPTTVTFGVVDTETQLADDLQINSFEYVATASISRIVPSLTTVLGGDLITVKGANFAATDHVWLETAPAAGTYQEMLNTYVEPTRHQFIAPMRSKGIHRVYVTDQFGQPQPPRTRNLTYFQFTNLTLGANVLPSGADEWDGVTTAVGDFDLDGDDDLYISRVGAASAAPTPETRVLRNDGTGHFTDVTSGTNGVMPAVTATEDWRANRIWASDINLDGYPDLVLVTNDTTVLSANKSHVRLLINEPRSGLDTSDRLFRDRTVELFPAVRSSSPLYGGTLSVVDNWRGLDMWVGDVDRGGTAPPEILITHKELKEELDVGCGAYCASPYSSGYTYGFYWGASRAFAWNKAANAGQGKYKFEHNFFPRKAGVRVQIFNPPAGVTIPICNSQYGSPCRGKFTPFSGRRIAVGDLNADGKPDVAVLSDVGVTKNGATTSSLQVGINKFNAGDGALVTDVTDLIMDIGGSFQADTIEIGQPGFPDGNSFGIMAITKATASSSSSVMRVIKFKTPAVTTDVAAFEEITAAVLPPTGTFDKWQASKILFRDVDTDGDQDMVLVSSAAPGGVDPAFRILRNVIINQQVGIFRETLRGLITPLVTAGEHLEGEALSIGDVNKDGALDYVITRATTTDPAPQTRILITDK